MKTANAARRADIQGLRAVAVLLVIADHVFGRPVGGFIGVDVFFVISGFLITGLLVAEGERSGRISLVGFYQRRARRILPAALLVLAVTVAGAAVIFSTARYEATKGDVGWALVFLENWHLAAAGTDYFQSTLPPSPVQHFWSLAVEEQFYVVWPLLLIALLAGARRAAGRGGSIHVRTWAGAFAAAVIVTSFGWAMYQSAHEPTVAYFSTFTRAWELGAGALLAVAGPAVMARANALSRNVLVVVGLVGLVASAVVIEPDSSFPAPLGALPVVATVMLLAAGIGAVRPVAAMWPLVVRPVTYIGAISYSLYLWHWPVVIFLATIAEPSPRFYLAALGATAAASVASYHLVEQPFQHPERRQRRYVLGGGAVLGAGLLAVVALVPTTAGGVLSPEEQQRQAQAAQQEAREASDGDWLQAALKEAVESDEYPAVSPPLDAPGVDIAPEMAGDAACLNPPTFSVDLCTYGPADAKKTVVVVGDSVAVSWMPTVRAAFPKWRVHGVGLSNCPFPDLDMKLDIAGEDERCRNDYQAVVDHIVDLRPDMVIASGAEFSITRLASGAVGAPAVEEWRAGVEDWKELVEPSGARLVILSPNPSGPDPNECYNRFSEPGDCAKIGISSQWTDKSQAESGFADVEYVDTSGWFCWDNVCPIFAAGTTIRWDLQHLTASYAELVAPRLRAVLAGPRPDQT